MMYLIPKNIKVKSEVFKGYGIKEILIVVVGLVIGYLLSMLSQTMIIKFSFFSIPLLLSFIITFPLPNGLSVIKIIIKYVKYSFFQKGYKKSEEIW